MLTSLNKETVRGVSFTGAPLGSVEVGDGDLNRTTKLSDVDLVYDLSEPGLR